jgi:hypothetical protein
MSAAGTARSLFAGATGALMESVNPLQGWLDVLEAQGKALTVLELEMWIKCFDRFFRVRNHPMTEQEIRDVVRRDFAEELKIVRSVSLRMGHLCSELLTIDRADSASFGKYIQSQLMRDDSMSSFSEMLVGQLTPEDSLTLLIESLADLRAIVDGLTQLPSVSFQAFTSVGKLVNREIKRCRYIEPLVAHKFKPNYDRIDHAGITALIKAIESPVVRQDVATVFLESFRLLRYLSFIEKDLREDRPLKKALLVFSLVNSEARLLQEFMERRLVNSPELPEEQREMIDGVAYAMSMEFSKVFGHELVGFVHLRQAPPIYAKVENSHGLLLNCVQQTIVGFANIFDPELNGSSLFNTFQTRRDQSMRLRGDIWRVICYLRHYEACADKHRIAPLIDVLSGFRDGAMKYLMYKDWEQYEQFNEEIVLSRSNEELSQVLHRFATYLETLLGQICLRAVLANDPFEYPKVKVE